MKGLVLTGARYTTIILLALYTLKCFTVFRHRDRSKQNYIFVEQNILMFLIHFISYVVLFIKNPNSSYLLFYGLQFILILFILLMYNAAYPESSRLIINNMCMLMVIGFIFITRLDYKSSFRQFLFVVAGIVISIFIPFLIKRMKVLRKLWYVYAAIGIGTLLYMHLFPQTYGAHIQVSLFGFSFQPQEFVKILFVFMVASVLDKATDFKRILLSAVLAAAHVLILVWGSDLGVALIFSFVYIIMIFIATGKFVYFFSGIGATALAFFAGYKLFAHVRVRVAIWLDPFKDFLGGGYQVALGLFAMANAGWFGVGLGQGLSEQIPLVKMDMMIIPIIEEWGLISCLLIMLITLSCFIMFLNISSVLDDGFYKLLAIGLGTSYILQVFLTIGGSTKFIPMTGVTLPFISYGASSILSTIISFSIIQGLYVLRRSDSMKPERPMPTGRRMSYE